MRGKGVQSVSCSDGCTAAISSSGLLYTWGENSAGQLGHGHVFGIVEPKRVMGLGQGVKVRQVCIQGRDAVGLRRGVKI